MYIGREMICDIKGKQVKIRVEKVMAQNEVVEASCIRLTSDLGAKYAILPGDPTRVEVIARYLDNPKFIKTQREYTSWEGYLDGEKSWSYLPAWAAHLRLCV